MGAKQKYCTFYLENLFFGVEACKVREVVRHQPMTHVPLAPPAVRGLINLRGQIVTAIDLRQRLGMPEHPNEIRLKNIVMQSGDDVVSLLIDRIGDIMEIDEDDFERPPQTLDAGKRQLIRGAFKLKERLLLILDAEKVTDLVGVD